MGAIITKENAQNFRGRDPERMNQWFLGQGYALDKVESIQIEIRKEGFRENPKQCQRTAKMLSNAITALISTSEKQKPSNRKETVKAMPANVENADESPLVNEAFTYLKDVFRRHFHEAMLEAGRYIIEKFYGGDYERAQKKEPVEKVSLNQLSRLLKSNSGDAPSKTWVYDAVNLAVDEQALADIPNYGAIGHSNKILLTHVSDRARKHQLIREAAENDYTVARLRERIKEIASPGQRDCISVENLPDDKRLERLSTKKLKGLHLEIDKRIGLHENKLGRFKDDKIRIEEVIKKQPKGKTKVENEGFDEWASKRINFQTGCLNDCIYCYAKKEAYRLNQIELGSWSSPTIRKYDVDKKQKLYSGLVGFPSSHDITPDNVSDYLYVLGKLLRAGNEVLIVSKPRFECIQKICEASQFFRDKVIFRFTIGAMSDEILRFWEPNAPIYAERKKSLEYAYENKFRTSVSIEPMLDSANLVDLVADIEPLVNETIWIGIMNYITKFPIYIDEDAKPELETRLKQIEAWQTKERLEALHEALKSNPKVKWKTGS